MGRNYCCVTGCHNNSDSKPVKGKPVTLHRIPKPPEVRKQWLERISRKNFKPNDYTRICNAHFVNGVVEVGILPSIFPHKTYKTTKLGGNVLENLAKKAVELHFRFQPSEPLKESLGNGTPWAVSLLMHDYCGPVDFRNVSFDTKRDFGGMFCPSMSTSQAATQTTDVLYKEEEVQTISFEPSKSDKSVECIQPEVTVESLSAQDFIFYTGLPSKEVFNLLLSILVNEDDQGLLNKKLRIEDQLLLVLMRLRVGLMLQDLAVRFKISKSLASSIFNEWIVRLETKLKFLIVWPSREVVEARQPSAFNYFGLVRSIVDCTEIGSEVPAGLQEKAGIYSDYKSRMTWKALVAISSFGTISFVSDLFGGNTSDKEMIIRSNFLDGFEEGDGLMADKGFLIHDLCLPRGINLIVPPKKTKAQFDPVEVEKTRRIANLRIHVERAMERIKNFKILQTPMPLSMSYMASKIFRVCACLCNLQPPLISPDDEPDDNEL